MGSDKHLDSRQLVPEILVLQESEPTVFLEVTRKKNPESRKFDRYDTTEVVGVLELRIRVVKGFLCNAPHM